MPLTKIKSLGITDGTITGDDINSTFNLTGKTVTLPAGTGGKVLQVVSTTKTDGFTTTSGSFVDITGMSVSITPSSTSNKILIVSSMIVSNSSGGYQTFINLLRGASNIAQSTGASNNATITTIQGGDNLNGVSINFLDSPSTTSSTTYKLQMKVASGTGAIGRRGGNTDDGAISTISAIEIAG